MNKIADDFNPFNKCSMKALNVKYVYPSIDFRTNTVFAVHIKTMGGADYVLHTQNECRDLPVSLYDRCVRVLLGEPDVSHK